MELLIGGLAIGSVYALLAIGVVLVFRATAVVNFAQGELMMVAAYAYVLAADRTTSPLLQLLAAVLAGTLGGLLCYVVAHVLLPTSSKIAQVIGTISLLILLQASARYLFTDDPLRAEAWLFGDRDLELFGANVAANSLLILGTTVIATGALFYWQGMTVYGRAVRAVAEDPWRAALSGIHVASTLATSWAVGGALAGVAAVLISPIVGVFPTMGVDVIFPAFIAAVLGGFSSILGALIGGLALGLIQTFAVVAFGGTFKQAVMFAVLLAVLLWRPTGIFAPRATRRA